MSLATERMGGGLSAGQANAIGGGYAALTAVGSTQANGVTVTVGNSIVSGANGTTGAVLTSGQTGDECNVFNDAGSTLNVYPPTGGYIAVPGTGLGTQNAAFSHLTYKSVKYICLDGSTQHWMPIVSA